MNGWSIKPCNLGCGVMTWLEVKKRRVHLEHCVRVKHTLWDAQIPTCRCSDTILFFGRRMCHSKYFFWIGHKSLMISYEQNAFSSSNTTHPVQDVCVYVFSLHLWPLKLFFISFKQVTVAFMVSQPLNFKKQLLLV